MTVKIITAKRKTAFINWSTWNTSNYCFCWIYVWM